MAVAARRRSSYHLGWAFTFLPALILPLWGWADLREPLRYEGLGIMAAASLLIVPVAVLVLLYFVPAFLRAGCVRRDWRKRYRQRHGRAGARSAYIRAALKRVVFFADRYRCASCHMTWAQAGHLEIDHVMPWSLGGLTTLFNCMALCPRCNKIKSNYWRYRSGHRVYVPFEGWANETAAAEILRRELRHRWNLFRLLRAAFALGF